MEDKHIQTNEKKPVIVDYTVFMDTVANDHWVIKKVVMGWIITTVLLFAAIVLMFINNQSWLNAWNEYDYSSTETTVDSEGDGIANYTGGDGGVYYGASDSKENNAD